MFISDRRTHIHHLLMIVSTENALKTFGKISLKTEKAKRREASPNVPFSKNWGYK